MADNENKNNQSETKKQITKTWWLRMQPRSIMRTIEYLPCFAEFEGQNWDEEAMDKFSVFKSKKIHPVRRRYTYKLHDDLRERYSTLDEYLDGEKDINETESRGRNEKASFEFYGFAYTDENGYIKITKTGKLIKDGLMDEELLLKQLLKLQFPSPINKKDFGDNYVFPLEVLLKTFLYYPELNRFEIGFLFGCININKIQNTINAISKFRNAVAKLDNNIEKDKQMVNIFSKIFNETYKTKISDPKTYYGDYADAFARCLEYTGLFSQRGRGLFQKIYIPTHSSLKVQMLQEQYSFTFNDEKDFCKYIEWYGDPYNINLPWDNEVNKKHIVAFKIRNLKERINEARLKITNFNDDEYSDILNLNLVLITSKEDLYKLERKVTEKILQLNEQLFVYYYSKTEEVRGEIIEKFRDIDKGNEDYAALWLECNTWKSLIAVNGSHKVKRNFKVEEDLSPRAFAPGIGNTPDMELYKGEYVLIPEVSLMTGVKQWEHEGSSVIDHVLKFVELYDDKQVYGIFISSSLYVRTIWQFFILNRESWVKKPVPVIPITIKQYIGILENLYQTNSDIDYFKTLIKSIHQKTYELKNYEDWKNDIDNIINNWKIKEAV